MPADLHIHTKCSDGLLTPAKVVKEAKRSGLTVIAISDHDTVEGIDDAVAEGGKSGVEVIPAVEFSTDIPGTEVHILGYFIDHRSEHLKNLLKKIREDRTQRIARIAAKLKNIGVDLDVKRVMELAGNGSAGRPHVARAMVEAGIVGNVGEAFSKYLDMNGPAYEPHFKLTPKQAIDEIVKAGGIPVLAHPAVTNRDELIPELVSAGLRGIEVYYSRHSAEQVKRYLDIAKKNGLLVTGGSDFHGKRMMGNVFLGMVKMPDEDVEKLKAAVEAKE